MAEDKKKIEMNRIRVELAGPIVEVESSTESLSKVYKVLDDIILKITMGRNKENERRKHIESTAIR